jgi:putative ABC transport system permease protein
MLSLKNIVKDYAVGDSKVPALKGVNIVFRENEFVCVLGPSGCGKTTLLNIIGGLDQYTKGDLIINNKSTKDFSDSDWDVYRNNSVGFVFQSYNLIPHQTVLSNVELALTLSGVSKAERRKRAQEALEKVGLGDQLHKKPNQLSGGQMQRVAIARALVNNPDILLADEPTGALDSETSVQIMEILKEISKDRLIVMVTHNPELAQKYSSRIVRLLDGQIIDDTDPYNPNVIRTVPDKAERKKRSKAHKTSMSFFTALSLSLNNLMTKKTRTFMTAFAGSIGIIGIALIMSLSNGVQSYITKVEEDTLSSYPLTIEEKTVDLGSLISSFADKSDDDTADHALDKVYSFNIMTNFMDVMMSEVTSNNLTKFKEFLESPESGINDVSTAIQYTYSTPLNIYNSDTSNGLIKVNPNTLLETMGFKNMTPSNSSLPMSGMGTSGMGSMGGMDVWKELLDNDELLAKQYKVLAGKIPEKYDEVAIVVNEKNEISDYTLYSLGLKDSDELKQMIKDMNAGKDVTASEQTSYTYDELLSLSFKLLVNTDYFEKKGDIWEDKSSDDVYIANKLASAPEIKVVGILRPDSDSIASQSNGFVGYRSDLMKYLVEEVNNSEIVKQQKDNPDVDVFTGIAFKTNEEKEEPAYTMEYIQSYIASLPSDEQAEYNGYIQQMYANGMTDEQIIELFAEKMRPETTDATYDGNLSLMGVADINKPSAISIYPKDFKSKDVITDIIKDYNSKNPDDKDDITYTDYIGLLMSSVTTIINAISYILIAFVAISLVVSSIMIGIITYISVLERTKEIGILRAIGASKKDISRVFNAETLIVGFVAGAIGIGITLLLTIPINSIILSLTDISGIAVLPWMGGVILVIISMVLTFIAGLIPSRIAAKKDPVVALRSE